jgi:hypothetical protein
MFLLGPFVIVVTTACEFPGIVEPSGQPTEERIDALALSEPLGQTGYALEMVPETVGVFISSPIPRLVFSYLFT